MEKGEWDRMKMADLYVNEQEKNVKQDFSLFELLTSERHCLVEGIRFSGNRAIATAFAGMKYPCADNCPFKNFVSDFKQDIVANILVPEKEILVIPYKDPRTGKHPNLFYDKAKAMSEGLFYYNGSIQDALNEFRERGFVFHLARNPSGLEELEKILDMKSKGISVEKRFIVTAKNVPLDIVFGEGK